MKARALLSSASLVVLALAVVAPAVAAEAPAPAEVDQIVVTGFRGSLQQALVAKKDAAVAVDTILAEDIGKFPDLNLSESIQRIPGVALARDAGEGRQISVRGLGPQFTRVRINGMEALTTTGSSDAAGGTNRGRSFDFNVFASDLFSAITVRKTAEAATEEGSLGATVDLTSGRPFDHNGFKFVASGQMGYNDLAEKNNPRGAFMVSNTWADGTFGALLSVAYGKRDTKDVGTSTVRWATGAAFSPGFRSALAGAGVTLAQANAAYHPRFPRFDDFTSSAERLGVTTSLQWRPAESTLLTLDVLYADFKATREERYLEAPSFSVGGACTAASTASGACGIAQTDVVSGVIDSKNTLVKGTFNNVDLRVEDRFDELDTKFNQFSLTGEHEFTDRLKASFLLGHSQSKHENPIQTTLTLDQFNVQGYSYDYSLGRVPLLSYGSANLTNPASWVLTQIRERPQTATNKYDAAQTDWQFQATDALRFQAGLSYKKYNYVSTEMRRSNGTTTNQETIIPASVAAIPLSSYTSVTSLNTSGLGAPAGTAINWLVPNLSVATSTLNLYDQSIFRLGREPALGNNNSVNEKDTGGYIEADWKTELMGMPLRGNVGVRYVKTKQSASGYTFVSGAPVAITVGREYSDTLPSLNLVLEPVDNFLIRFGASKVMSRPNLGNLTPGATVSVSGASRSVTAGNPNLDPFRATAYDLSFEWYFNKDSLISVALFKKQIDSLVQTLSTTGTFTGNAFGLPDSIAVSACGATVGCSPSASWNFSTPINTPGGDLDGYELSYQQAFTALPGLLSHTGAILNYTSVKSSINYLNAAGAVVATTNLTGLSRESYNATLYYEDDRISTRVSAAYRSKYLTRVPGQEAGTDVDGNNETFNVDASFQYTFNEHLKFTLEGVNLTDEFQDQYNDSSNRVSFHHHTGREYLVGVRYTF